MSKATALQAVKRYFSQDAQFSVSEATAFSRLYAQTYLSVFRYVYGLTGGPLQEVEDLTAEAYARAWKTRDNFHGNERAALGWMLRIAKNLVIDLARNHKVRGMDEGIDVELLVDPDQVPESDLITREQIAILWQMLISLPDDQREMLVLRYILGWQVKQIAQHLNTTENNVSVTMRRTLNRLQRDLSQLQEKDNE